MTLIEHLNELRNRMFKASAFIAAGTVVGCIIYGRLLTILKHPYCALPPDRRYNDAHGNCQLVFFNVADGFMIRLKVAVMAGMLSYQRLMKWQRMAIFLIFVFAAVATPSQDPFSMIFMAVPLCLLFEVAVLVARIHDKRKAAREAAESFADLPDDVASPLDVAPSDIEPAE